MSSNGSENEVPTRTYSEMYDLEVRWKGPLIYPKTGKRRMTVEYEDLFRLKEDEFLNDNLIGFFLRYLEHHLEQTNPQLAKRVYFYNSYFFERLMQTSRGKKDINYESVQKWTRNVDIFNYDFIVMPVNESFHWYVVIICNLSKLDSKASNQGGNLEADMALSEGFTVVKEVVKEDQEVMDGARDQPTEKTTESMSNLSLSDHDKQLDELAPTVTMSSPAPSSGLGLTPRKTGPGRRKGVSRYLRKYDISGPVIITFDSLGSARSSTCTALRQYIIEEAKDKKGWSINGSLIKGMTAKGIPTQPNYSDCGLYLCAYLEKFIVDPAGFVGRILQREMDPKLHMPMMASKELRSRMLVLITELHHEQEGEVTRFPKPEIGKILLAPARRTPLPDGSSARHPSSQDDSEDELQRDQTNAVAFTDARIPTRRSFAGVSGKFESPASGTAYLLDENSRSGVAASMTEIVNAINASPNRSRSKLGTEETAITIDDDEDSEPLSESDLRKIPIGRDDFFDHPSELENMTGSSKTPLRDGKSKVVPAGGDVQHRRSQSRASADTVNTDYLSGNGHRGYEHGGDDAGGTLSDKAGPDRPETMAVVPDSQGGSENEEGGEREWELGGDEPQEIVEGIE